MKMPFTTEQFFSVFESYNLSVFPAQIVILLAGVFLLFFSLSERAGKNKTIGGILGLLWIWMGLIYHIIFFAPLNPPAYMFGALFIFQGILFFSETYKRKKLIFRFTGSFSGYLALFFILFGLIIYPVISYILSGSLIKIISFGLPCPTTIATFGFLILAKENLSKYMVIIPATWAFIGTTAAFSFGVYQDLLLIISAVAASIIIFIPVKKSGLTEQAY